MSEDPVGKSPKTPIKPNFLSQARMLHETDRTEEIYSRAFSAALAPSRRQARLQFALNLAYYSVVGLALAWIFSMAIDRAIPVQTGAREVMNPDRKVAQGARLLVKSTRRRLRSCELTRRWAVIDGDGRRYDYEPERFDAYGPVTPEGGQPEAETTGPTIPLDAMPGRGRWISALAWDCNMLQRALGWSITQVLPPVEFEIVPRESRREGP